jgi:flagellar hook protein FlgE
LREILYFPSQWSVTWRRWTPDPEHIPPQAVGAGTTTLLQADKSGMANIIEASLEVSSVNLADQCTKMIVTQQAYNNAAQAIRTVDEITQIAATMKG